MNTLILLTLKGRMRDHGFALALSKTDILTKNHIQTIMTMHVDLEIKSKPTAKYLEVMVDNKMSFGEQIRCTTDETTEELLPSPGLRPMSLLHIPACIECSYLLVIKPYFNVC